MGDCIGIIAMFIMLAVVGWVIDKIVPGKMPYGIIGGIVAAIVGGLIGGFLFEFLSFGWWAQVGDFRYYFIPGLLGGIVLAFIIRFVMGRTGSTRTY
ncbi:MAG: GlsB/YeaQ/YmgE family stress response membrane protein [Chloroflexia bacterium]